MIFFYEFVFIALAIAGIVLGETLGRTVAVIFSMLALGVVALGVMSFDARLATGTVADEDRRWFTDARDGLKHLRLLLMLGALAAVGWRLIAG